MIVFEWFVDKHEVVNEELKDLVHAVSPSCVTCFNLQFSHYCHLLSVIQTVEILFYLLGVMLKVYTLLKHLIDFCM